MFDTLLDPALRLVAAMIAGMAIGLNRDLHGKPTGVRTLGLVGLGAALVTYGALHAVTAGGSSMRTLMRPAGRFKASSRDC